MPEGQHATKQQINQGWFHFYETLIIQENRQCTKECHHYKGQNLHFGHAAIHQVSQKCREDHQRDKNSRSLNNS